MVWIRPTIGFAKHGSYRKWLVFWLFFYEFQGLESIERPKLFSCVRIFLGLEANHVLCFCCFLSSDGRRIGANVSAMGF